MINLYVDLNWVIENLSIKNVLSLTISSLIVAMKMNQENRKKKYYQVNCDDLKKGFDSYYH